MLIRLIYASTATDGVDLNEFKRILQQAQVNNQRRDLTGMLAFNSKIFLQALEGARDQVNDLYSKLVRDPRHNTVTMLAYREIGERHWADWSMGFAAPKAENRALFLKYSQQSVFNPYGMNAEAVEKMLMELTQTVISMNEPMPAGAAFSAAATTTHSQAAATPENAVRRPAAAAPAGGIFARFLNK